MQPPASQPSEPAPLPTPLSVVVDANMIMSLLIAEGSKNARFAFKGQRTLAGSGRGPADRKSVV